MGSAFCGIDIVGERRDARGDVVDILQRYFHLYIVDFLFHIENLLVNRLEMTILESDERAKSALEVEGHRRCIELEFANVINVFIIYLLRIAQIDDRDAQTLHEICLLTQM